MEKETHIHPRYTVTEEGDVYTIYNKEKVRMRHCYSRSYPAVRMYINGKSKDVVIHRLVAIAFIPNPENKPCVNHIDGNKLNFHVSNLEWVTHKENSEHAKKTGLHKAHWGKESGNKHPAVKAIIQYTKDGVYMAEYESQTEASRITGVGTSPISSVLTNRKKTGGGFIWRFKNQEDNDRYADRIKKSWL